MVKRLTHRILTPTFMGSIPITPVYVKYSAFVDSNPTSPVKKIMKGVEKNAFVNRQWRQ